MATPLFTAIREALNAINWNRGRGDITAIRLSPDGTGQADRKGQYFRDTIKFRIETRKGGRVRVFALGTSRVSE